MASKTDLFTQIAQTHLHIETLQERKMDDLDFHDVGVVGLRRALEAAYQAGLADGQRKAEKPAKSTRSATRHKTSN